MKEVASKLPDDVFALAMYEQNERVIDKRKQKGAFRSGLLLQKVGDHYERMGSFKHETRPWLDMDDQSWSEQTITIK